MTERAPARASGAPSSLGAGKSSPSSSPGSTTSPPPDDDRPYSAARRSASAARAAASRGRPGACSSAGATADAVSPADAGGIPAAFLRPRPPDADERRARQAAPVCSTPRTGAAASTEGWPSAGPAPGVAACPPASGGGTVGAPVTGAAAGLPARRRRAAFFFGKAAGPGGVTGSDGITGRSSGTATLPAATVSGASSSGGLPATVRGALSGADAVFRPPLHLREDAGSSACHAWGWSAGTFPAGASPCGAPSCPVATETAQDRRPPAAKGPWP